MTGIPEEDQRHLDESIWEGMGNVAPPAKEDSREMALFFRAILEAFSAHHYLMTIEEATSAVIGEMDNMEKQQAFELAKRHFVPDRCYLHDREIVPAEDSPVTISIGQLTQENFRAFLSGDGSGRLRAHLKHFLGEAAWATVVAEETNRELADGHFRSSTAG